MKKRIKYVSTLIVVAVVTTCFGFESSSPQPVRALALQTDGRDFLVWQRNLGIVPGQMIRISVANPAETPTLASLTFHCMVFDQNGILVFQTEGDVAPREFRYEDILYGDLGALAAEPGPGRKQMRLQVVLRVPRSPRSPNIAGSLEIIDGDTGKTAAHITFPDAVISSFQTGGSR